MPNRYRMVQGHLFDEFHGVLVDPFLLALIRHHTDAQKEQTDIVRFCSSPFDTEQLSILLPLLESKRNILDVELTKLANSQGIAVKIDFGDIWWHPKGEIVFVGRPPDVILSALPGRPVSDVLEHPYVPRDMIVDGVSEGGGLWKIHVRHA